MIDEGFRTLLVSTVNTSGQTTIPVEQDTIDQELPKTRVWYQRGGRSQDTLLNGTPSLVDTVFNVEVMSESISTTQTIAASLVSLNGNTAMLTSATSSQIAWAIYVDDQADDYIPKNDWMKDQGFHIASLKITVQTSF